MAEIPEDGWQELLESARIFEASAQLRHTRTHTIDPLSQYYYRGEGGIPDNVKARVKWIKIDSSVEEIPAGLFDDCPNLTNVFFEGRSFSLLKRVEIHEHQLEWFFRRHVFSDCWSLEIVEFTGLSKRREAIALDERAASKLEGLLRGIANIFSNKFPSLDYRTMRSHVPLRSRMRTRSPEQKLEACELKLRQAHGILDDAMRENTTTLELALWKKQLREKKLDRLPAAAGARGGGGLRSDRVGDMGGPNPQLTPRQECRVNCGANVVIEEVLKFFPSYRPRASFSADTEIDGGLIRRLSL